jgi:pimeloyl-ACP methyl ester carboxylesterase
MAVNRSTIPSRSFRGTKSCPAPTRSPPHAAPPTQGQDILCRSSRTASAPTRSYWDLPFNNWNYSYTTVAVDRFGFSTLTWDRVGVAESTHGDPIQEIQAPLELAVLSELTSRARDVNLANGQNFNKIVHVGHSLGSALSYVLAHGEPSATDGIVLQAFALNGTFFADFLFALDLIPASTMNPSYAAGYLASGNPSAFQTSFFRPGMFDPDMLSYAYTHGQPGAVDEFLTIGGLLSGPNDFSGPVMVVTGERDLPFCGGDCYATGDPNVHSIPDAVKAVFPKASKFNATVVPGGGHALNMEYGHDVMFQQMNDFLAQSGLG